MRPIAYARPVAPAPISAARIILAVAFAMCLPLALVCGTVLAGLALTRPMPETIASWAKLPEVTRIVDRPSVPALPGPVARGPAEWRK